MHTVIGVFEDKGTAESVVQRLVEAGVPQQDVHIEAGNGRFEDGRPAQDESSTRHQGFFAWLFGDTQERHHADTYSEAVRRGNCVVVVDARDEEQADRAASLLHEAGAVNVDERAQQWREGGWNGTAASGDRLMDGEQDKVLDVVQEELQVGKRQLDRGGVRVVQRVSEQPVREVVNLREERAVVERRNVDRPAEAGDLTDMRDQTIEVRESFEEPVVSKKARVVEEVRVGKEVREREQTVEDSVRRKDVDVQRLDGDRITERERAFAAERRDQAPLADRSLDAPDAGLAGLAGTRSTSIRKDKPSGD